MLASDPLPKYILGIEASSTSEFRGSRAPSVIFEGARPTASLTTAAGILTSLATPKGEGGYLNVDVSGDPDGSGILAHGVYVHSYSAATGNSGQISKWVEMDHATIWGDYFFLEALQRYRDAVKLPRPCDGNADDCVDGLDYVIWSNHYGECGQPVWSVGGWAVGNYNQDDCVDGLDFVAWSNNYLQGCPAQPGQVPEPASAAALLAGWAVLLAHRRRERQGGRSAYLSLNHTSIWRCGS